MPVEAHRGGVIREVAIGRTPDGTDQVLHGFSRVHMRPGDQGCLDVNASVAVEHAVGEEHQSVARAKRQLLHLIRPV